MERIFPWGPLALTINIEEMTAIGTEILPYTETEPRETVHLFSDRFPASLTASTTH